MIFRKHRCWNIFKDKDINYLKINIVKDYWVKMIRWKLKNKTSIGIIRKLKSRTMTHN